MNIRSQASLFADDDVSEGHGAYLVGYSTLKKILSGCTLTFIILMSLMGNVLVVVAVLTDSRLKKKKSNALLVSLAFADILVSLLVMSLALFNDVHGRWEFGKKFCLVWECFDITFCTSSILNLCLICTDRFIQIKFPLHYGTWMTNKVLAVLIFVVWLMSIFLSFVPLHMGWHLPPPDQRVPDDPYLCILDLSFEYALGSSSISFYIPCIFMLVVYAEIYRTARAQAMKIKKSKSSQFSLRGQMKDQSMNKAKLKQEHKAVITLGIIMGTFLLCWLPFFIVNPIAAKCAECIPPKVFQLFLWLGYANSCANPIIYSLHHNDFRNAFRRRLLRIASTSLLDSISTARSFNTIVELPE